MRILSLSLGTGIHDLRFIRAFAERHEVLSVLCAEAGAGPPLARVRYATLADCAGDRDKASKLRRIVERERTDIVFAGPLFGPGRIAAMARVRPLAAVSWGYDVLLEAGRGDAAAGDAREILEQSDLFVCDCQAVLRMARELCGGVLPRSFVAPWGTDLGLFKPGNQADGIRRDLGWEGKVVALATRSFEPMYGPMVLARGFARAAHDVPGLRLLVAGDGSLRQEAESFLHGEGLGDRVCFLGAVDHARLPGLHRAADVYVSATLVDGSSISLLEALASGVPALVSDVGGNPEWVEPGVNGALFATGNAESLGRELVRFAALRTEDRVRLGRAARRTAEERADWGVHSRALVKALEDVAAAAA